MKQSTGGGILLVEDDEGLLGLLAMAFRGAGFFVRTATDTKAAMRALADSAPAALITDIILPDGESMQLIRAMKAARPTAPVVAMSGGGMFAASELVGMARGMGANAGLSKPFRLNEAVELVSGLLSPQAPELAC